MSKRIVLRSATSNSKGLSILDVESGTLTPLTPDSGTGQPSGVVAERKCDHLHQSPGWRLGTPFHSPGRYGIEAVDHESGQ